MSRKGIVCGALWVVTLASACSSTSDDSSGTTGQSVVLKNRVVIKDDLSRPFTNALGWDITLTEAYLSVGSLYYFSGDPVLSQRSSPRRQDPSLLKKVGDWLVPSAYAHPGHYIEGAAMGQMLEPLTVDLLAGAVDLADGEGVTGLVHSAKFTWQSPPKGKLASKLNGQVVLTRGVATKDALSIRFLGQADATEVVDGNDTAEVAGCSFGAEAGHVGVDVDGNGLVTLTLVPSVWFNQVDFDYVALDADGAPRPDEEGEIDLADTLAWQGFIRGVKKGTAYEFSFEKEGN
jgi:hypothetical protein